MSRELISQTPAFKRFAKSLSDKVSSPVMPAHSVPGSGSVYYIHAPNSMLADNGAQIIKHTHPIYWIMIVGLVVIFAVYVIGTIVGITTAQAMDFSDQVRHVAQCEGKTPNAIHHELRTQYGYNKYTQMNQIQYQRASNNLDARMCDF